MRYYTTPSTKIFCFCYYNIANGKENYSAYYEIPFFDFYSISFFKKIGLEVASKIELWRGFYFQEKLFLNCVRSVKRHAFCILLACKSTFPIDKVYQVDVRT